MIYNPRVAKSVRDIPIPIDGFVMDVVEYEGFLAMRFFEGQWIEFSEDERMKCALYLAEVKKVLNAQGIQCTLEPLTGFPGLVK